MPTYQELIRDQGLVPQGPSELSASLGGLFDDAEGDPADVVGTPAERADGASNFASRRDHAHYHGALTVADPLHPMAGMVAGAVLSVAEAELVSGWTLALTVSVNSLNSPDSSKQYCLTKCSASIAALYGGSVYLESSWVNGQGLKVLTFGFESDTHRYAVTVTPATALGPHRIVITYNPAVPEFRLYLDGVFQSAYGHVLGAVPAGTWNSGAAAGTYRDGYSAEVGDVPPITGYRKMPPEMASISGLDFHRTTFSAGEVTTDYGAWTSYYNGFMSGADKARLDSLSSLYVPLVGGIMTGSLGIGTAPSAPLHVLAAGAGTQVAIFANASGAPYITLGSGSNVGGFWTYDLTAGAMQWGRHGGSGVALSINSSNNVVVAHTLETQGLAVACRSVSASATVTTADSMIAVTGNAAAVTLTLPAVSAVALGRSFRVKDLAGTASALPITLAAVGADTIDGAATQTLTADWGSVSIMACATGKWGIV